MPLTEMGKSRQGVGTGLSGTGEHGSSVLLRHAKSEGESDSHLRQTSLKVRERSGVEMELWEPSVYRVFKATGLNESTKIMRILRDV